MFTSTSQTPQKKAMWITLLDAAPSIMSPSPKKDVRQLSDRLSCSTDEQQPVNRVNTTQRLEMLRTVMALLFNVDAYVITGDDQHQVTTSARLAIGRSKTTQHRCCLFLFVSKRNSFLQRTKDVDSSRVLRAVGAQPS